MPRGDRGIKSGSFIFLTKNRGAPRAVNLTRQRGHGRGQIGNYGLYKLSPEAGEAARHAKHLLRVRRVWVFNALADFSVGNRGAQNNNLSAGVFVHHADGTLHALRKAKDRAANSLESKRVDITEQPTAGHFVGKILQGKSDGVEKVFDEITPRQDRDRWRSATRFACLSGRLRG